MHQPIDLTEPRKPVKRLKGSGKNELKNVNLYIIDIILKENIL
jgi:hypothetical protein